MTKKSRPKSVRYNLQTLSKVSFDTSVSSKVCPAIPGQFVRDLAGHTFLSKLNQALKQISGTLDRLKELV